MSQPKSNPPNAQKMKIAMTAQVRMPDVDPSIERRTKNQLCLDTHLVKTFVWQFSGFHGRSCCRRGIFLE
jgi:hypothetical protein